MKQLLAAGFVLAALLLTACGRDAKPIELPPPVEAAAPVVIDVPLAPPVATPVPAPKPKPHSKSHRRQAPRPMVITPRPVTPAAPPAYEEFCFVGVCASPPYRMEN
jgi:predicted small lipoprotein YifL